MYTCYRLKRSLNLKQAMVAVYKSTRTKLIARGRSTSQTTRKLAPSRPVPTGVELKRKGNMIFVIA